MRIGGGSYLSASDDRIHFGLREATSIDEIEMSWPSVHVDHLTNLRADTGWLVREGEARASPLRGWGRR
jgi:hypothetical protein